MQLMLLCPVEVCQLIQEQFLKPGWPFVDRFFHIAHFGIKDNKFATPEAAACLFRPCHKYTIMETLKSESVTVRTPAGYQEYKMEEKDHGDLVVYDIFRDDHYLLTLAGDGSILFMNFDADEKDKEIFNLSHLNIFIEKIKAHT
jgi:hypothetical protein